ncbi:hypothetical protein L6E12_23690 [Actinokineospora sp. PR83]|uniref:hypothetical protein n=1 Tax=Actinokineospora sp. PR83 TaxID=2884908 RepID=UPI001F352E62|nr:hypothetical protein [Actinokineospora sp. PR83]MCG8918787.1 hypothetical protein [Actinokineospora sp. PR83]
MPPPDPNPQGATVPALLPNLTVLLGMIGTSANRLAHKIEVLDIDQSSLDDFEYACRHAIYVAQWFIDHQYTGPDALPPNADGSSPIDPDWYKSFGPAPKWPDADHPSKHRLDE